MLLNVFKPQTSDKELARAVEAELVETLYASRLALAIGAVLGIALSAVLYHSCPREPVLVCGIALSLCGALRVVSFQLYTPTSKHFRFWQIVYELGALTYAGLLGTLTALIILFSPLANLHFLAGVMATGYAAGAASRNTGRPVIAIGQFLLTQTPWTLALMAEPSLVHGLLFVSNILFGLVVTDLTLLMFRTVLNAFVDRQEKRQLAVVYEKLSKTDPLTGLGNRTVLEVNLGMLIQSDKGPIAVAWIDLDRFKQINDTLGHGAGDRLLRSVSAALSSTAGEHANIARFGGDEFVISTPIKDEAAAMELGDRLLRAVRSALDPEGALPNITASIGLAISDPKASVESMLRHADLALYEAKAQGRDQVKLFNPSMERELVERRVLELDLKRALQAEELDLHYQPIVDLNTGRIQSFEALIRWNHRERGMVPATSIIGTAESAAIMEPLTRWVLVEACKAAASWPEHISIAVNISPTLVHRGSLTNAVIDALLISGLSPKRLELELTESAILEDSLHATSILNRLQEIGVRLSLDDFGTGYSSLSYLCRYRFDTIKIDRSFTHGAELRSEARAVILAITTLAKSMNLAVVAEGIETDAQAQYIRGQDCGFGQGYLFSKPIPYRDTLNLLDRHFLQGSVNRPEGGGEFKLAS